MAERKERQVIVVADAAAIAQTAATRLIERLKANKGRAAVCLTGGSSPEGLYRLLAEEPWRSQVPWDRVHWFMGDDRFVPENDPLSNMGMARRLFLNRVKAPRGNVHPVPDDTNYVDAAARFYAEDVMQFYGEAQLDPARPLFDLVLMGLGGDGHTASLFPGSPALDDTQHRAVGVAKAGMEPFVPRVTLTFPTLASTREMLFLVDGAAKRDIIRRVFSGEDLPAARAYAEGDLVWLLDRAAAPEELHAR